MFLQFIKRLFGKTLSLIEKNIPTRYLGSNYGGWYVAHENLSSNLIVFSAGAGEDISFDIEMLNNFQCKIIIIDPTPRAIQHIERVKKNLGKSKTLEYDQVSGNQPVESYDLSKIKKVILKLYIKHYIINQNLKLNSTNHQIKIL